MVNLSDALPTLAGSQCEIYCLFSGSLRAFFHARESVALLGGSFKVIIS